MQKIFSHVSAQICQRLVQDFPITVPFLEKISAEWGVMCEASRDHFFLHGDWHSMSMVRDALQKTLGEGTCDVESITAVDGERDKGPSAIEITDMPVHDDLTQDTEPSVMPQVFHTESEVMKQMVSSDNMWSYVCSLCDFRDKSEEIMRAHGKEHYKNGSSPPLQQTLHATCQLCGLTTSAEDLWLHLAVKHKNRWHCRICRRLISAQRLSEHCLSHLVMTSGTEILEESLRENVAEETSLSQTEERGDNVLLSKVKLEPLSQLSADSIWQDESAFSEVPEESTMKNCLCLACNQRFPTSAEMLDHEAMHLAMEATVVPATTTVDEVLPRGAKHRAVLRRPRSVRHWCEICGYKATVNGIRKHHARKHAHSRVTCAVCGARFGLRCDMQRHCRRHFDERGLLLASGVKLRQEFRPGSVMVTLMQLDPHFVPRIKEIAASHADTSHMIGDTSDVTHDDDDETLDDDPEIPAATDPTLDSVGENRGHMCDECGVTFCSNSSLGFHIKSVHNRGGKPFACTLCNKTFVMQRFLTLHTQRVHSQLKRHVCAYCGHAFFERGQLVQHEMTHQGDQVRKHSCAYCKKLFIRRSHAIRHEQIHLRAKKSKCNTVAKSADDASWPGLVKTEPTHSANNWIQ